MITSFYSSVFATFLGTFSTFCSKLNTHNVLFGIVNCKNGNEKWQETNWTEKLCVHTHFIFSHIYIWDTLKNKKEKQQQQRKYTILKNGTPQLRLSSWEMNNEIYSATNINNNNKSYSSIHIKQNKLNDIYKLHVYPLEITIHSFAHSLTSTRFSLQSPGKFVVEWKQIVFQFAYSWHEKSLCLYYGKRLFSVWRKSKAVDKQCTELSTMGTNRMSVISRSTTLLLWA